MVKLFVAEKEILSVQVLKNWPKEDVRNNSKAEVAVMVLKNDVNLLDFTRSAKYSLGVINSRVDRVLDKNGIGIMDLKTSPLAYPLFSYLSVL